MRNRTAFIRLMLHSGRGWGGLRLPPVGFLHAEPLGESGSGGRGLFRRRRTGLRSGGRRPAADRRAHRSQPGLHRRVPPLGISAPGRHRPGSRRKPFRSPRRPPGVRLSAPHVLLGEIPRRHQRDGLRLHARRVSRPGRRLGDPRRGGRGIRTGRTTVRETVSDGGFAALVAAHSRALEKMSGDIADAIRGLEHGGQR